MEDILYSTANYNKMLVKNRLVRSATFEMATTPDGGLTEEYLSIHQSLAKGGIGMLITGITGVAKEGRLMPSMPYTTHSTFEEMLHRDAQNMESENVKLIVQLCSGGVLASSECGEVLAPSSMKNAREMNSDQIETLIEQYVESAKSCERAGAHGVQIHAAHGFVLSQFLSPHFNHRKDEYGGNIANRTNITRASEGYNFDIANRIANSVQVPILVVGGFRSFREMENRMRASNIAAISLSRPLICEPHLPNKWFHDRSYQPKCKSCNKCFMSSPLRCKMYGSPNTY